MSLDHEQRRVLRSEIGKIERILRPFMFASSQDSSRGDIRALQYTNSKKFPGKSRDFDFLRSLRKNFNTYAKAHRQAGVDINNQTNYPNKDEEYTTVVILNELQKLVDVPTEVANNKKVFSAINGLKLFKSKLERDNADFKSMRVNLSDEAVSSFFSASHESLTHEDLRYLLSEEDLRETNHRLRSAVVGLKGQSWERLELSKEEEKEYIKQALTHGSNLTAEEQLDRIRYVINKIKYTSSDRYASRISADDRKALFVHSLTERKRDFDGLTANQMTSLQESYRKIVQTLGADFLLNDLEHMPKVA